MRTSLFQPLLTAGLLLTLAAIGLTGCQRDVGPHRFTRFAMGTVVEYVIQGVGGEEARIAVNAAHAEVERVAMVLWEGEPSSEIAHLNSTCDAVEPGSACGPTVVSSETAAFLKRALSYAVESEGGFDVTIGSFLSYYDFSLDAPSVPDSTTMDSLVRALGDRVLSLSGDTVRGMRHGIRLAVGGVAKGYAVDRAVSTLRSAGIENALVNAGGDMYCLGSNGGKPWRVGVRDPDRPGSVTATLEIEDAAVATSGDYQQFVELNGVRYHHILDPETGWPARRSRSATVIAGTAERADALATGLFVSGAGGLEALVQSPDTEGLVIESDGSEKETVGFHYFRRDHDAQE